MKCCDFPKRANHQIVIRSQSSIDDAYGGQSMEWATAATVWAWIRPIPDFNVSEQFKQDQLQAIATHKIIIRYNSSFKDIKDFAAYSISFDGRIYNILSIKNFDKTLKNYGTEFHEMLIVDNGPELSTYTLLEGLIGMPSGFTLTLPFLTTYDGTNFTTDLDITTYKITPTTTYYVATTGSSGNDGLTIGNPKASVDQAIVLGNASAAPYEIRVATGTYDRTDAWKTTPTENFNVIGAGAPILSFEWETKTGFVLTTTNTYKVTRSNTSSVYDSSVLDSDGDYEKLTLAASSTACEATAGTWYTDNADVWVHTSDNRDLSSDATDIKLMLVAGVSQVVGNIIGYVENINFEGGNSAGFDARNSSSSDTQKLYFKDCSFKYSATGNGYKSLGTSLTIMDNCITAKNYLDGFNYHVLNSVAPDGIEVSCIGRSNGYSSSVNNNASSMHDAGRIFRINGVYKSSEGRNIHDISLGTLSMNIACNSNTSRDATDSGSVNYMSGDGSVGLITKMWLLNCLSSGSNIDLRVEDDSFIYTNYESNLINGTNTIDATGTIESFIPTQA